MYMLNKYIDTDDYVLHSLYARANPLSTDTQPESGRSYIRSQSLSLSRERVLCLRDNSIRIVYYEYKYIFLYRYIYIVNAKVRDAGVFVKRT